MAKTVDQLVVEIRAETAQLRKGLNQVNSQLGRVNKSAKSSLLTFGNLSKVFVGLGLTKLVSGVVRTTRTFEDLKATIQANTGSVEETADAFQDILAFTKTTTFSIEQVTKAFIEFRRLGISATQEQFKGIGNVAAAQNISIDQMAAAIFKASTTSIESLQMLGFAGKTNGDKITLSFGSGADKIEETMEKTTENVLNFVQKVGETRFSTALEDRLNTVSGAFINLDDKVAIFQEKIGSSGLNKSLVTLASTFQTVLTDSDGLAENLGGILAGATDTLNTALIKLNENAQMVKTALIGFAAILTVMTANAVIGAFATAISNLAAAYTTLRTALVAARTAMIAFMITASLNPYGAVAQVVATATGAVGLGLVLSEIEAQIAKANSIMDTPSGDPADPAFVGPQSPKSKTPTKPPKDPVIIERLKNLGDLHKAIDNVTVKYTDMARVQKILNDEVAKGNITQDAANQTYRDFLEASGPFGKAMAQIGTEVESLSKSFSDELTTALMEGQNALESFKNLAFSVVQAVISAFMELLVIQPIVDAILGAFSISSPKGGTGKKTGTFAGGGSVQGKQPYLVGERGAELFIPNTGGTIMNNMNTKTAMGSGQTIVVNQSVNFATGVVPTVRAEVTKMMPQIADVTKGAVAEAAMRGGNYRRMLQGG